MRVFIAGTDGYIGWRRCDRTEGAVEQGMREGRRLILDSFIVIRRINVGPYEDMQDALRLPGKVISRSEP